MTILDPKLLKQLSTVLKSVLFTGLSLNQTARPYNN